MELLTHKDKDTEYSYYLDKPGKGVVHGVYKRFHSNGKLWAFSYWCHGRCHGEYKAWDIDGELIEHCFYINGERYPCFEMNAQEKLLFQIQHPDFRFIEE